jgi:DNA invertase Pin-like site-specific DNA recombinase
MDENRRQAIKEGMARAAKRGRKPTGRPRGTRRDLDLDPIRQRIQNGESLRSVATALGISPGSLSKRLREDTQFFDDLGL